MKKVLALLVFVCLHTHAFSLSARSFSSAGRARLDAHIEAELASTELIRQHLLDGAEKSALDPVSGSSNSPVHTTVTSAKTANGDENTIDTGDEGGSTTVVLSNQNSVGVLQDETRVRKIAQEQQKKVSSEQNRKQLIAYQIRSRSEAGRKLNEQIEEQKTKLDQQSLKSQLSSAQQYISSLASQRANTVLTQEQASKSPQAAAEQSQKSSASQALSTLASTALASQANALKQQEDDAKYLIQDGVFVPKPASKLAGADKIVGSTQFSYAFWIRPDKKIAASSTRWTNIFAKGVNDTDRNPAVFLWPASTKLHVRSRTPQDPSVGCDPSTPLVGDKWTHVVISHAAKDLEVFFNGASVCQNKNVDAPASGSGDLWGSSPWYDPAPVLLADFRYYPRVLSNDEMSALLAARKFQQ